MPKNDSNKLLYWSVIEQSKVLSLSLYQLFNYKPFQFRSFQRVELDKHTPIKRVACGACCKSPPLVQRANHVPDEKADRLPL